MTRIAALSVGLILMTGGGDLRAQAPTDPNAILAAAREALGGAQRLSSVRSVVIAGRMLQLRGNNLASIEVEMSAEFPDKFARTEELPAQETGRTTTGFSGNALIESPAPSPRGGGPAPTAAQLDAARQGRVDGLKQDFARLMLGFFATSFDAYPLTFTYVGEAEADTGRAAVLDAKGPSGGPLRLFISRTTNLPLMITWDGPPARGQPTPAPTQHRLYFGDYRETGGIRVPFRLRHAVGAATLDETTLDRVRINPKIDPGTFEARR
jgi:hypothetical protein